MSKQIHRAPFAITLDGKVVANLVHAHNVDLSALKSLALHQDDELFVGVVLRSPERRFVRDRIENALHDALGWVFGLRARAAGAASFTGVAPKRSSK